jgi:hypothetical protein
LTSYQQQPKLNCQTLAKKLLHNRFFETVLNDLQGKKKGSYKLPYKLSNKSAENPIKTLAKWYKALPITRAI